MKLEIYVRISWHNDDEDIKLKKSALRELKKEGWKIMPKYTSVDDGFYYYQLRRNFECI